jgi:hypothetical protein
MYLAFLMRLPLDGRGTSDAKVNSLLLLVAYPAFIPRIMIVGVAGPYRIGLNYWMSTIPHKRN